MVAHGRPLHFAKRDDPLVVPTAAGIINTITSVGTAAGTSASGLAFDSSAATTGVQKPPPLAPTDSNTPVITITPSPSGSSTESSAPTVAVAEGASTKPIAMSTVVATCVGAFIGAGGLILVGFWVYRRYSLSLKQRSKTRGPLIRARNLTADEQRRRSRLEPWNKLDDDEDKWEEMYQTKEAKEADHVAPMEKLTMFKKTPSVRTAYTHKSTDVSAFDFPHSYAEFDPKLAETLSTGKSQMPEPRPFVGRVDTNLTESWDSETAASKSYLSVRTQMSSGAMSPTLHMAIPTPPPMAPQTHMWESAEVVQYSDSQAAEPAHPFGEPQDGEQRRSAHNPFFNARDDRNHIRSRSNSVTTKPATAKGKERMRYSIDPFDDINEQLPKPQFIQHAATASSSSTESKEKALQSLIAALDIPEEEVRDRLRIASMQPSVISQLSSIGGYDDVTKDFPLPPSRPEDASQHP